MKKLNAQLNKESSEEFEVFNFYYIFKVNL